MATQNIPQRRVATEPVPHHALRRSMSLSSTSLRADLAPVPQDAIETLYNHPSAKIIAFTSSQRPIYDGSGLANEPKPGSLVASSQLERTIAVGPFRIYRAPGSVAFLNCGSALQPILPKSQCWCIDEGNSRFVLQIRRPQYWRIEIPVSSSDDVQQALALKQVFDSILLFEKTECPFQRTFTVEIPERPQTPVKKRPWTPAGKNLISSPLSSPLSPQSLPRKEIFSKKERPTFHADETFSQHDLVPVELNFPESSAEEEHMSSGTTGEDSQTLRDAVVSDKPSDDIYDLDIATKLADSAFSQIETEPSSQASRVPKPKVPTSSPEIIHYPIESPSKIPTDTTAYHGEASEPAPATVLPNTSSADSIVLPRPSIATSDSETHIVDHKVTTKNLSAEPIAVGGRDRAIADEPNSGRDESRTLHLDDLHDIECDPKQGQSVETVLESDPQSYEGAGSVGVINLKQKRMSRILAGRSVTLPPQLTLVTSPPSKSRLRSQIPLAPSPQASSREAEDASPVGSTDSFHSVQSWHSPITPSHPSPSTSSASPSSFPYPYQDITISSRGQSCSRDGLDHVASFGDGGTAAPSSAGATVRALEADSPRVFSPVEDTGSVGLESVFVPHRPEIRHRPRTDNLSISRRALSPLPPAANLFSPKGHGRPASRLEAVRKLPGTIIHKTVEILLSPPSHLVNLMLQVAAKIVAGEWRGLVFGLGEGGESIPVHWDYSDEELSSWGDDDDYTFSMGRFASKQSNDSRYTRRPSKHSKSSSPVTNKDSSWEVD